MVSSQNYEGPGYIASKGVNGPVLAAGMIPIKWNGTTMVDTNENDPDWYYYTNGNKKWANARTADGSMWVWIPRYIYKISSGWHGQGFLSEPEGQAGVIDVQFSNNLDDTLGGTVTLDTGTGASASDDKWTNHPAFWWDNDSDGVREEGEELSGIWVAKFAASGTIGSIDSKPNATSLTAWSVNSIFNYSREMEIKSKYGWGTTGNGIDTHMMKNVEWGAVAYLAHSVYGKNSEVWINPADSQTTGCAGRYVTEWTTTGCMYTYDTLNGQQSSTTGNISGVYDMAGNVYMYVVAYENNNHTNFTT